MLGEQLREESLLFEDRKEAVFPEFSQECL
jgi:hypothetical protein